MINWLTWNDLTEKEQKQAKNSYVEILSIEDEEQEIKPENVTNCRFERMPDGYIYVDIV